ncbi:MAG: hypothetical protein ACRC62_10970 [Microcoleus sp.]
MWISVNPKAERKEIVMAAMALSGWYEQGWSEDGEILHTPPSPAELPATELAALYNNAENLELDLFSFQWKPADRADKKGGNE